MCDKLASVLKQPFYVWLLGIYPIFHLYSENLGLVKDREVLYVCGGMLAATTLAFLVANRAMRCRYKTAFMLSICSLVFSLSGHVYVQIFIPRSLFVWTLLLLVALLILVVILRRRASSHILEPVTPALNLILLALLAIPVADIASSYVSKSINLQPISAFGNLSTAQDAAPKVNDSFTHPDIYYIIPDGYPSDHWLQKVMRYDNSAFTKALKNRRFVVADHAQSNYWATLLSLASVLNMQFFDNNPLPTSDLDFLRLSITDNKVARQLQQMGYTYVQLLSGFWMPNPSADIIRDFTPGGTIEIEVSQSDYSTAIDTGLPKKWRTIPILENYYKQPFLPLYLETTFLRIVSTRLNGLFFQDDSMPYSLFAPERFLDTVDEVGSIARMPEATFTIVHLTKPHLPVVFDENGNFVEENWQPDNGEIIAQLNFINLMFLKMIDSILEESRNPPVIVFQADHGSLHIDSDGEYTNLVKFAPYAAYHLPEGYSITFPKPFTLVNTFPLLFNEIFETNYELRVDRLFEPPLVYKAPFEQEEVTARYLGK
ncbi:MAG: hypothetical protein OXG60_14335 [Chloroflexi bacterium]|nr:hypothetical protein [Chloroflexota bacterium]